MAMTQAQFDALVARLEREAAGNPGRYKLKLGALASLGYLYVLVILLVLAAIAVALGFALVSARSGTYLIVKLMIPIVILIGIVIRALWVKLEAPRGLELRSRDHPVLFSAIEEIRRAAQAPKADVVVLTNELNAAIVQVPRLGLFGWQKNYLILGLPLMQLMTPDEFKAVLAHEFGHLSGAHGRFGAWIYRIRAGWARLSARLEEQRHWGRFLFAPFFGWFAPKFAAWSFVQARRQEYEADRVAAEAFGAAPLAHALIRLDLKGAELNQHYWPGILAEANDHAAPTATPFSALLQPERRAFLPDAEEQLRQALERKTDTADTHPCLTERIGALGQSAAVPPPPETSAAEALFGDGLAALAERFDKEWREAVAPWWADRHRHVQDGRERLAAYHGKSLTELSDDALFEYAQLTEEFDSPEHALPVYESLAARETRPLGARFSVARLVLEHDDEQGVAAIEALMDEHSDAVVPGCEVIIHYLQGRGRDEEARPYVERYWRARQREAEQQRTRYVVGDKDRFAPAAMSATSIARIREVLDGRDGIKCCFVVQKAVAEGEAPLHVIAVERSLKPFKYETGKEDAALTAELANTLGIPEDCVIIALNTTDHRLRKRISRIPGAQIFG